MSRNDLLTPLALRGVRVRNRIVISPMCQYSALDGMADDWHLVQLGRFAMGGAGLVFVEATAVVAEGRITHGDLGLWCDAQIPGLERIAAFVSSQGAVAGIQLGHAGRKAGMQRPWFGNGALNADDHARGDIGWTPLAPSPLPVGEGWATPREMTRDDMARLKTAWAEATQRAIRAGFEVLEVHCAHGYLLHEFLSPLTNRRTDAYGGDFEARCRFPFEVIETVRAAWPADRPLFVRVSAVDGVEGGWTLEDTIRFARGLRERGVDVVDCSSGGVTGPATAARLPRGLGYQVPFAEAVRREAGIATMAVGLIRDPRQADAIVRDEKADLVAIGREALFDVNWPLHAEQALCGAPVFDNWPHQFGWWLEKRAAALARLDAKGQDIGPPLHGTAAGRPAATGTDGA